MIHFSPTPTGNIDSYLYAKDKMYSCLYTSLSTEYHTHKDFYELSLITYGEFENEYKNKRHKLPKNTLIFFKVGESHAIYSTKPRSTHCSFVIKEQLFQKIYSALFPTTSLNALSSYEERQITPFQAEYLTDLINQFLDNSLKSRRETLMRLFLHTALSCFLIPPLPKPITRATWQCVDDLLNRLDNLAYLKHKVHEIYSDYPMSQSVLITEFKKRTGYTIAQYHTMKKLDYAAQLLTSSKMSVTEICSMLYFSSVSHFITIFKKRFAMTPKEYQRLHALYQIADENKIGLS